MKKFIYGLGIFLSVLIWFGFGSFADDPSFSFRPTSGTKLKLYCESPVYMMLNGGSEKFNAFEASILFDPVDLDVIVGSIHSEFKNGNNFLSGNLYNVGGAMAGGYKEGSVTGVSFSIISKRNILATSLSFVNKYGNPPEYGLSTTQDGITLNDPTKGSKDILTGVYNTTYEFQALPCDKDATKPTITSRSVSNGATKVSANQVITFITYDWNSSKKVSHWFSGNDASILDNYVPTPTSNDVDNQEGVDSSKIIVTVSCTGCSPSRSSVSAELTISDWNGDSTKNALTWDSERRGYNVSINPPFTYEVEKKVTINISVTDNPNEDGQTHTQTDSFSFNAPVAPNITRIYPIRDTFVSPSKDSEIEFYISDDRAGVDTGSVVIEIPSVISGGDVIFSGYTYSGSELTFTLSGGSAGLGNSGSYFVSFYPKADFPVNETITINVTGADLAGTYKTYTTSFSTRPNCSFFGCVDSLSIVGYDFVEIFTGIVLIVTGTNSNSPYPYLTGENNEILMCSKDWDGSLLSGNVNIYDKNGTKINGSNYTGNILYVTGLDFEYGDGNIYVN